MCPSEFRRKKIVKVVFFVKNVVLLHTYSHLQPRPVVYFHNFLTRRYRFEFELNLPPTLEGKPIYHIIHPFDSSHWTKYEKKKYFNQYCVCKPKSTIFEEKNP